MTIDRARSYAEKVLRPWRGEIISFTEADLGGVIFHCAMPGHGKIQDYWVVETNRNEITGFFN